MNIKNLWVPSLLAVGVSAAPALVSADDEGWSGSGEGGITIVSGNSDSEIITAGLKAGKKMGAWDHSAQLSILKSETDGEDSADSLLVGWVSKRELNDRSYVFGDLRYLDDDFDSFEAIKTYSIGYGYKVLVGEEVNWDLSAGVGYRDTEYDDRIPDAALEADGLERDIASAAFIGNSIYENKLSATTTFSNETRIEATSDNTYAQNVAALSVAMSDALALKLKYDVRHNTDPAPGSTSTDKITSVNVVYDF